MKPTIRCTSIFLILFFAVTEFALSNGAKGVQQEQQAQQKQQCKAILKNGNQCKRKAQAGSIYCWQHTRMYGNGSAKLAAPVKIDPNAPAQTEPTSPAKTEPTSPAKTEPTSPAKTVPTVPAKTEPTSPAKTEK